MTNQTAVTILKSLEQSLDDYCELNDEGKEVFRMAVDALERSKWIPCTERLPELWDYVLCSQINGDVGEGKLLDDECWHICYDQSHRKKSWVVAWQPLPEKFKEEGGEE